MAAVVTSANPAITDLAAELTRQLESSANVARATIGARSVAFDWASGITPSPLSVFASSLVDGLTYRATQVAPSGTPAIKVLPGGTKPNAATVTTTTETLPKYAGYADVKVEDVLDVDGLLPALENVIFDQCLTAFSADVGIALQDAALSATTPSGGTWADAILAGIAALPAADVLVVSPQDLAAIVSPSSGFQVGLANAIPTVFGLSLVALPGLVAGTAYVMKSSALCIFDTQKSPLVLVDCFSQSTQNITRIVCDLFAAAQLTAPGAVVAVTVTP